MTTSRSLPFIPAHWVCSLLLLLRCEGFRAPPPAHLFRADAALRSSAAALAAAGDIPGPGSVPLWISFEAAERAASRLRISAAEFGDRYALAEAYTSCDDDVRGGDGDSSGVRECAMVGDYVRPARWIRLREKARAMAQVSAAVSEEGMEMEEGEDRRRRGYVEDAVRRCVRWSESAGLLRSPETSRNGDAAAAGAMMDDNVDGGSVRIKVVPSWFGPEGFEYAVREAAYELLRVTGELSCHDTNEKNDDSCLVNSNRDAVTLVVCVPEKGDESEFKYEEIFAEFAYGLRGQMLEESEYTVAVTPFHPQWDRSNNLDPERGGGWKESGEGEGNCERKTMLPYPTAALSLATASATAVLEALHQIPTMSM